MLGCRLNEAWHFCPYPPHSRKKMSILRIIPKHLLSESRKKSEESSANSLGKFGKIIFNQQSEEIAVITYNENLNSDISVTNSKDKVASNSREIQIEINSHQSSRKIPLDSEIVQQETIAKHEISSNRKLSPLNDEIVYYSKSKISLQENISSQEKISYSLDISSKNVSVENNNSPEELSQISQFVLNDESNSLKNKTSNHEDDNLKKTSWWRNFFRQFIVDFFLQLLGKKYSSQKQSFENNLNFRNVSTSTSNYYREEKIDSNGDRISRNNHNNNKKLIMSNKRILNFSNDAQHEMRIITYGKEERDKLFFDLIQLTQDENLRAIIFEQAMRMRILEEENARFRKKLTEKLKTRQSSSPFY